MKSKKITSDRLRINAVFSVRFTFDSGQFGCKWFPRMPTAYELPHILDKYRQVRREFFNGVSQQTSQTIACVEVR